VAAWQEQAETALAWAHEMEALLARVENRRQDGAPGIGNDDAALPPGVAVDSHLAAAIRGFHALLMTLHHEARHGETRAYLRAEDASGFDATLGLAARSAKLRADESAWRQGLLEKVAGADTGVY
jgi:hypothetical protein